MDPRISGASPVNSQSIKMLEKAAAAEELIQVASEGDFEQWCELEAFNPMAMIRRFRPLAELKQTKHEKTDSKARAEEKKIIEVEKIEEVANRFQRNNYELQSKTLLILRSRITANDSPDDVIQKVLEVYSDYSLADEALDFLVETADAQTATIIKLAKDQLGRTFGREIAAGRNMGAQAREFSKEGLGSTTSLRDMYRDITGTAREPLKLFDELSDKFPYEKLKTVIHFLLHSLGADLRSKGPSISRPELKRLIDETRSLQGILGVYRFFKGRMPLIERQFNSYQVAMPSKLDFDVMSKQFIKFLSERFMTPDKILQAARNLGISEEAIAQVIIFTQMRDAIKQISPRYYRNNMQREEILQAFLKALEELEDTLEEEEAKDQEKDDQKKKKKRDNT